MTKLMEELGQQQQQRHARELELEHAAMKAQIAGEREGLVTSLLQHKELQGQLARAKGDNLSFRSEASDLRARPATLCAPGCNPMRPRLQPYVPDAATLCAWRCAPRPPTCAPGSTSSGLRRRRRHATRARA